MALRFGIPTIYQYREFAAVGGLLRYGESFTESYRLLGLYTGRIYLKVRRSLTFRFSRRGNHESILA